MLLYNVELMKKIDSNTEALVYHSGTYDNNAFAPIFGIGGRKKQYSATFHKRFGVDYNAVLQYSKPLPNNIFLTARTEIALPESFDFSTMVQINSLTLDYLFKENIKVRAGVGYEFN
jgi:hypothetical protein